MDAASDKAIAGALSAAAHGLVERLGHAVPVVQRQAPMEHELDCAAGQAGAALSAVGHHRQRPPAPLLPPAKCCFESVKQWSDPRNNAGALASLRGPPPPPAARTCSWPPPGNINVVPQSKA